MPIQQIVNTGATSNDGTGDSMPVAGTKINANFTALWNPVFTELPAAIAAGTVLPATAVLQGKVLLDQADPTATVITKKTLAGANGLGVIFRPVAGKAYVREPSGGLYYELVVNFVVGIPALGIVSVGVPFAALPPA